MVDRLTWNIEAEWEVGVLHALLRSVVSSHTPTKKDSIRPTALVRFVADTRDRLVTVPPFPNHPETPRQIQDCAFRAGKLSLCL